MPEPSLVAAWQRATHRLLQALDAALGDLALPAAEVNVLACFGAAETVSVRALVVATGQRPSTLTGVLDRLERRGFVERRPHPDDRRSLLAVLTPRGREAAGAVAAAVAALEARLPPGTREAVAAVDAVLAPGSG